MCSGSEEASYLSLIYFVDHSTLGSRVIKKKREERSGSMKSAAFSSLDA